MRRFAMAWVLCVVGAVGCGSNVESTGQTGDGQTGDGGNGGGTTAHDGTLGAECGGIAGWSCKDGLTCVDDPSDECDPTHGGADCTGTCQEQKTWDTCGGVVGKACKSGFVCADDPSAPDHCDDCFGLCIPDDSQTCAGLHGTSCPDGSTCENDPRVGCTLEDPDCTGVCVSPNP